MLNAMVREITPDSIVLMDETLSSTSAYDGSLIAEEILQYFARIGCRCIFSTHIHELAMKIEEMNTAEGAKVKIDSLVVFFEKGTVSGEGDPYEGRRTFRVLRQAPEGRSYAKDIARKYGLIFEAGI